LAPSRPSWGNPGRPTVPGRPTGRLTSLFLVPYASWTSRPVPRQSSLYSQYTRFSPSLSQHATASATLPSPANLRFLRYIKAWILPLDSLVDNDFCMIDNSISLSVLDRSQQYSRQWRIYSGRYKYNGRYIYSGQCSQPSRPSVLT